MITRAGLQTRALADDLLRADVDRVTFRRDARISWVVAAYWTATIVVAWWTPWIILAWVGTSLLASVLHRRRAA